MSPNPSLWCTTQGGIRTVPMLEGRLAERTCSVPSVTGLLPLMVRSEGRPLTVGTGWGVFPGPLAPWPPKAGSSGFGLFMLLGSRESMLAYTVTVFCACCVRHCTGGSGCAYEGDGSWDQGALSHMDNHSMGFPGGSVVKNPPANAGDMGSIPGSGRSSGEGDGNTTPGFLPGESHGQRSLAGYRPWGCKESDTTEQLDNKK